MRPAWPHLRQEQPQNLAAYLNTAHHRKDQVHHQVGMSFLHHPDSLTAIHRKGHHLELSRGLNDIPQQVPRQEE